MERPIKVFLIWLVIAFLVHYSTAGWYYLAKWTEFIVSYATIRTLFRDFKIKSLFLSTFVAFSSIQAILALWQFLTRSSVGLNKLGETLLSPTTIGIAKVVSGGITYVRGYGTFPHPNLLSAYLCAAILIILYLLNRETEKVKKLVYSLALFINVLGLTVTFSRAAFLATILSSLLFLGVLIIKRQLAKSVKLTLAVFGASIIASLITFQPFLLTRVTISDSAYSERIFYSQVGIQMLKHNPIFGVGIGESVLHMKQYSSVALEAWQIQPVHNYFLLAATEMGVIGVLILIWIFYFHLKSLILLVRHSLMSDVALSKLDGEGGNLKSNFSNYYLLLTTVFLAILLLMQFDHYFYTLQQTQMLLWIVLGIIAADFKNPQEGDS